MLNQKFAVVDIETTGNDPNNDDILELSVIFVENYKIVDEYSTFLSDAKYISSFISELTTITKDDLKNAPKFYEIAHTLYNKLKDTCFVAHNIHFDLNFLKNAFKQAGINFVPNFYLDTVELTKIFFPTLSSFQLGAIANILGLTLTNAHRAYDDAYATAELLIKIINKMNRINRETKIDLYDIAKDHNSYLSHLLFSSLNKGYGKSKAKYKQNNFVLNDETFIQHNDYHLKIENLYHNFLKYNNYNHRKEQLDLIYTCYEALKNNKRLAIEASTGLGKSEAILIASLVFTEDTNYPVLISTSKKILQNQLYNDSLKNLLKASNIEDINISMLKGKSNYVDLNVVSTLFHFHNSNQEITMLKMRMLIWLTETNTGDLAELNIKGPERLYYKTAKLQNSKPNHYFYEIAVERAKHSRLCITNHYFLYECLSELEINHLIVDEAHQVLKSVNESSVNIYKYSEIKFLLSQIGINNKDRILKEYLDKNTNVSEEYYLDIISDINKLIDEIFVSLNDKDTKTALVGLNQCQLLIDNILNSLINTNNYQVLYNYFHHFKMILSHIESGLKKDKYRISAHSNHHKCTIYIDKNIKQKFKQKLNNLKSQVLISGTLEVKGDFKHLENWFLDKKYETKIIRTNDVLKNVDLFIPNDIHNLSETNEYIIDLVDYLSVYYQITNQKTIVIFTNYELLNEVYDFIEESHIFDFPVLKQTKNQSPDKLLLQYNQLENCLLLATKSFTEGINLKASNDKTIFLTKLPFPVPTEGNYNNFYKKDLPEAVFMFRQIIGRIKRGDHDSGRVVLFDNRILKKSYKNAFLKYFDKDNIIYEDKSTFIDLLTDL